MTVNTDLLVDTLAYIKLHPEEWDQANWGSLSSTNICGTAACFAGNAVQLMGWQLRFTDSDRKVGWTASCSQSDQNERLISAVAQELLGLNRTEADVLFWSNNTMDDLEEIVAALKNEDHDRIQEMWNAKWASLAEEEA